MTTEWDRDWRFGAITKKSKSDSLRREVRYYRTIPKEYELLFPRMVGGSGWDDADRWLTMEYYNYLDLGTFVLGRADWQLSFEDWNDVMLHLRTIISNWATHKEFMSTAENTGAHKKHAREVYIEETERGQKAFAEQNIAPDLFNADVILINDRPTPTFRAIWPGVKQYIEESILPSYKPGFMHGNFTLSSILFGGNVFKFVDPRGGFGELNVMEDHCMGDPRYDVAKLYTSVDAGYELFVNDEFKLTRATSPSESWKWTYGAGVNGLDMWSDKMNALGAFGENFFKGDDAFNTKDITLIEGLIYISECAKHTDNPNRQIVMYLVGLQLLNKAMML